MGMPATAKPSSHALPEIAIVVPCYNEEEALPTTTKVIQCKLQDLKARKVIGEDSFILYVDDGSADATWSEIMGFHDSFGDSVHAIKLSHNRGHQDAVYAGLMHAMNLQVDAAISMDADLQDDPDAIDEMIEKYQTGAEIVFGVRDNRDTDSIFKKSTAHLFYRLMRWMGTETIPDHADYRLMSLKALRALSEYREVNLFLRGIVPSLGFKTDKVYYKRSSRVAGKSKYPLNKMMSLAIDGVTSFSIKPLTVISLIGAVSIVIGFIMLVYTVLSVLTAHAQSGWASIMCSLWIIGGLILVSLGIIGEYIGRIYMEVKARPRYFIEESV